MNRSLGELRRRDFLRLASLAGIGLALYPLALRLKTTSSNQEYTRSAKALGTVVTIRVLDDFSPVGAQSALDAAFEEIRRVEELLTRFDPASQVHALNDSGRLESPSRELEEVLSTSKLNWEETGGAFDVTVKPALDLFQGSTGASAIPSEFQFERAKALIDFEKLSFSSSFVSLPDRGMGITLDCIGKGYALDRAALRLKERGVRSALIQGGGTAVAIGSRPDGSPWRIGVVDPRNPTSLLDTIHLTDSAVATSGDYENYFTSDRKFYHIIDPNTARSPLDSHSATVVAPTATRADPIGLAIMVKGHSEGLRLVDGSKGLECLIVTREDGVVTCSGWSGLR